MPRYANFEEVPDELIATLATYAHDPLGFVYFAFPWGEGELVASDGPEDWQIELLVALGAGLITLEQAIQLATTSGHGVGKSALVAWIILWALSTFEDTLGVVTANTETQLKTKTWAQLAKWYRLFIGRSLFKMTATALFSVDPEHERTWRLDMVPWSERNTEAFAGLHNQGKRILLIFDEASAIPDMIWEVAEGALTDQDTEIIWAVFGNPTRNVGRFRDCFAGGRFAHRWKPFKVDSRSVRFTDKAQIERWRHDWGEDSDFFRIRVRGEFPRIDATSFIPYDLAVEAAARDVPEGQGSHPVVLGVDVGRFGDDPSIIYPRQGLDAKSRPVELYLGIDTMQLAARVAAAVNRYHASLVLVDEGGVGGGVVDRLRQLGVPVVGVDFGSSPDDFQGDGVKYANKRAEIWGALKEELVRGLAIQAVVQGQDLSLVEELTAPMYGLNNKEAILLESKKDMRRRGVPSPNVADALACSFGVPIFQPVLSPTGVPMQAGPVIAPDYNPFSQENMKSVW